MKIFIRKYGFLVLILFWLIWGIITFVFPKNQEVNYYQDIKPEQESCISTPRGCL